VEFELFHRAQNVAYISLPEFGEFCSSEAKRGVRFPLRLNWTSSLSHSNL
jgi:hypothetical protein